MKSIVMLGMTILAFASCQNDDMTTVENAQVASFQSQELTVGINESLSLEAPAKDADSYAWYVDGQLVSSQPQYVFTSSETGLKNVMLEIAKGGKITKVSYAVSSQIKLSTLLSAYSLSQNGIAWGSYGYYWNKTYTNEALVFSPFTFSHTGEKVSGYDTWGGFTISNGNNNTNYGTSGTGGSETWITNQWGCMPANRGKANFLIGFWGYYGKDIPASTFPLDAPFNIPSPVGQTFSPDGYSTWVGFGGELRTVKSISVTNSPWAYYGCLSGDGFATAFTKAGDHLDLLVYPVDGNNKIGSPYTINLASYGTGGFSGIQTWKSVDLNFTGVKYLLFQMRSSDTGAYGMNTAAYFCLNDIVIE